MRTRCFCPPSVSAGPAEAPGALCTLVVAGAQGDPPDVLVHDYRHVAALPGFARLARADALEEALLSRAITSSQTLSRAESIVFRTRR